MGAAEYEERVVGFDTAQEAFSYITHNARYMYGHGGYSGTIAEKSDFQMIKVPEGEDPITYATYLLDSGDRRVNDKWGPAYCVEFDAGKGKKGFYFFGIASS
jgi:hypothetical protein